MPVISISSVVATIGNLMAHQIIAGSGKERLPAPPIIALAQTERIKAITGSTILVEITARESEVCRLSVSKKGSSSTPVENCSLNQSLHAVMSFSFMPSPCASAPQLAQLMDAIRQAAKMRIALPTRKALPS